MGKMTGKSFAARLAALEALEAQARLGARGGQLPELGPEERELAAWGQRVDARLMRLGLCLLSRWASCCEVCGWATYRVGRRHGLPGEEAYSYGCCPICGRVGDEYSAAHGRFLPSFHCPRCDHRTFSEAGGPTPCVGCGYTPPPPEADDDAWWQAQASAIAHRHGERAILAFYDEPPEPVLA